MEKLKLTIELLPKGAWGNDFSKTLSKKDWDKLRNFCYEKAGHKCAICGYETDDLDAHEVWEFDIDKRTQTLKDIIALCSKCHGVKHIRNTQRLGYGENAKKHFIKVNNCNEVDFASHLTIAQMDFEERNKVYRWKIIADLTKFGGENIKFKQSYIPFTINPYSEEEIEILKNKCDFLPRILNIEVDNYKGTIKVICDKTNKIEWISDKVIETKFNFSNIFKTEFCVKELTNKTIYFKLYGKYGQIFSKIFELTNWKFNEDMDKNKIVDMNLY